MLGLGASKAEAQDVRPLSDYLPLACEDWLFFDLHGDELQNYSEEEMEDLVERLVRNRAITQLREEMQEEFVSHLIREHGNELDATALTLYRVGVPERELQIMLLEKHSRPLGDYFHKLRDGSRTRRFTDAQKFAYGESFLRVFPEHDVYTISADMPYFLVSDLCAQWRFELETIVAILLYNDGYNKMVLEREGLPTPEDYPYHVREDTMKALGECSRMTVEEVFKSSYGSFDYDSFEFQLPSDYDPSDECNISNIAQRWGALRLKRHEEEGIE